MLTQIEQGVVLRKAGERTITPATPLPKQAADPSKLTVQQLLEKAAELRDAMRFSDDEDDEPSEASEEDW